MDVKELQTWRTDRETRLKSENNWLTVVGLDWLKEGENTVGAAFDADVRLPTGMPSKFATITRKDRKATIVFNTTDGVKLDDKAVKAKKVYQLDSDAEEERSTVKYKDIEFYVIDRKNGIGIRLKDQNSEARKNFKGLKWFEPVADMKINAKWVAYKEAKTLMVPDILGNVNEEKALGYVEFKIGKTTMKLYPSGGPEKLFFVFKDPTNGKETYKVSRFLYTDGPDNDGNVVMDFNRAYNPPCAFTKYATCPKAPKENILEVAIRAGEKKP